LNKFDLGRNFERLLVIENRFLYSGNWSKIINSYVHAANSLGSKHYYVSCVIDNKGGETL